MRFVLYSFLICLSVSCVIANNWKDISSECNLDELVSNAGNKLVLMEFYVPTCGHAMRITSALNDLAAEYPNVVFLKMDCDECEILVDRYNIEYTPTFIYFQNGKNVTQFTGANVQKVKQVINQYL